MVCISDQYTGICFKDPSSAVGRALICVGLVWLMTCTWEKSVPSHHASDLSVTLFCYNLNLCNILLSSSRSVGQHMARASCLSARSRNSMLIASYAFDWEVDPVIYFETWLPVIRSMWEHLAHLPSLAALRGRQRCPAGQIHGRSNVLWLPVQYRKCSCDVGHTRLASHMWATLSIWNCFHTFTFTFMCIFLLKIECIFILLFRINSTDQIRNSRWFSYSWDYW